MEKRILFTGKAQVEMENFEVKAPGAGELKLRTLVSLMSTGTENIVFNRLFEEGTGWAAWVKYPFYPGYTSCLVVEEVGEGVTKFKKGDRVVARCGHASAHIVKEDSCIAVPDGIKNDEAAWFGLAKIAAMGARAAKLGLGKSVVIVGAGPIGQMTARWCAAAGANPVVIVDTVEMRVKMALKGGATHGISRPLGAAKEELDAICPGGPDIIIDSTGHYQVFTDVLHAAKRFGRVVLLGDTGTPSKQCLTHDVMNKGLEIVGAHDCHEDPTWNTNIITDLLFRLVKAGRFSLAGLNTHNFTPEQNVEAYKTANEKRAETMGITFTWKAGL